MQGHRITFEAGQLRHVAMQSLQTELHVADVGHMTAA